MAGNRKNPSWQFSQELLTEVFEMVQKSASDPIELFPHLEGYLVEMLSESSSKRMRYAGAQDRFYFPENTGQKK